jgi:glycosyltransferase involved in cell wall biosynthesis
MRILQFLPSLASHVGGPARATIDLSVALTERGHSVTLLSTEVGNTEKEFSSIAGRVPRLLQIPASTLPNCTYLPHELAPIRSLLGQHDVLHVHGVWEYANIQLSRIAQRAKIPYVISVRGMLDDWPMAQHFWRKRAYLSIAGTAWLRGARAIHLTAKDELVQAQKFFPPSLGVVIPNLLNLAPFASAVYPRVVEGRFEPSRDKRLRVLFLGRIHPVKGVDILLGATALLKERNTPISLQIAGDGQVAYVKKMRQLAQRLGLNDEDVTFLGSVQGEIKYSLLRTSHILASPSQHENFGMVFVEALASGTPVVTTTNVCLGPELRATGAALIVDRSATAFANAITRFIVARDEIVRMGALGRAWAFRELDKQHLLRRFEALYGFA